MFHNKDTDILLALLYVTARGNRPMRMTSAMSSTYSRNTMYSSILLVRSFLRMCSNVFLQIAKGCEKLCTAVLFAIKCISTV